MLVVLAAGFELFPYMHDGITMHAEDFFFGFGHEALVAVTALMVVGHSLARTGALEPMGRLLARLWEFTPQDSFLLTLVVGAALRAFVNNVPSVILLLPILTSVSVKTGTPASRILMPMGFSTLIGGMGTTIGTPTNLLVVSMAVDMDMEAFSMFQFLAPVVISGAFAIAYRWLVAPHILPDRASDLTDSAPRIFSAALSIKEGGWADGKTIKECRKHTEGRMTVKHFTRANSEYLIDPHANHKLGAGDRLMVRDTSDNLKQYEKLLGADLHNEDSKVDEDHPLEAPGQQQAEVIVTQGSPLFSRTLANTRFADRYQLATLALHRTGSRNRRLMSDIANVTLQIGDVLLVQGASEKVTERKKAGRILVLDGTSDLPYSKKAPIALVILFFVVGLAALGIMPIAISSVCGVLLLTLTACLGCRDVGDAINTQIVLIVAASLALGVAMLETGSADAIADQFVNLTSDSSVTMQLSGQMLLMAVLTNIVSNNAAAVINTPIAIGIAQQQALAPESFVLAVFFGANMSYATPMAYKTNLLIMWGSLSFLVPLFFPV